MAPEREQAFRSIRWRVRRRFDAADGHHGIVRCGFLFRTVSKDTLYRRSRHGPNPFRQNLFSRLVIY